MASKKNKAGTASVSLEELVRTQAEMISQLKEQLINLNKSNNGNANANAPIYVTAPTDDTRLVYLSDALGYIEANGVTLNCSRYGETFVLSRGQIDAIIGKYRSWFDRGVLALGHSEHDIKVAAEKGVKTDAEYHLSADKLNRLGNMTPAQIEKLWNECTTVEHKLSIVTFYKRKFLENAQGYRVRDKVECLNRLTDNGFSAEVKEVSGLGYKLEPIDFLK